MKIAKRVVVAGLLIALAIGICVGIRFYVKGMYRLPEAYAAWTTADLIIDHMEANGGKWPMGWEHLRRVADTRLQDGQSLHWEFADLPNLVSVDWHANPEILAQATPHAEQPPFHVVRRKDGSDFPVVWQDAEPNQMILAYLLSGERQP